MKHMAAIVRLIYGGFTKETVYQEGRMIHYETLIGIGAGTGHAAACRRIAKRLQGRPEPISVRKI